MNENFNYAMSPTKPYLLVGLGNPGSRYAKTRHNLGFMVVDKIATNMGLKWQHVPDHHITDATCLNRNRLHLVKPMKYMNNCGSVVAEVLHELKAPLDHMLVICDDLNLPYGKIRLRPSGSDGGHNGMLSIVSALATQLFARLRIGIGSGFTYGNMSDFVLSPFTRKEKRVLPEIIVVATRAALAFVENGLEAAMNHYNQTLVNIPALQDNDNRKPSSKLTN